jgi:hypothetical protein
MSSLLAVHLSMLVEVSVQRVQRRGINCRRISHHFNFADLAYFIYFILHFALIFNFPNCQKDDFLGYIFTSKLILDKKLVYL